MNPDILKNKALPHYDELYPGKHFMEIKDTRDDSKSIVGTVRTITEEPIYVERPKAEDMDKLVNEIAQELDARAEQSRYRKGGYVMAYTAPEEVK